MASEKKEGSKILRAISSLSKHKKKSLVGLAGAIYLSSSASDFPNKLRAKMMLENYKQE